MAEFKLNAPRWNPDGPGWLADASVTEIKAMAGHGVKKAKMITIQIPEVPSDSKVYDFLIRKLIDQESIRITIIPEED